MSRNNFILKYIDSKNVIDLGCLGENKKVKFSKLHSLILKNSNSCLGVDIHNDRILELKKEGFNLICDNVIELKKVIKTNKKFDVIVAGELIEHLENPGLFLNNLKQVMHKDSLIILTTPNVYSLRFIIRHILFDQETPYWKNRSDEIKFGHVIGFSKALFKTFLLRHNFKIIETKYIIKDEYRGFKGNLEKLISRVFPRLSPSLGIVIKLNNFEK